MGPRETEQIKLRATFVNGMAIAVFAVGFVGPVFTALTGPGVVTGRLLAFGGACSILAVYVHLVACLILRRLPE